jgi:hypothetical protein
MSLESGSEQPPEAKNNEIAAGGSHWNTNANENNGAGGQDSNKATGLLLSLGYLALVLTLGILLGTNLIPAWGQWYSRDTVFRRQTQALLSGSLALSTDPQLLSHDMGWADGKTQQIGGLGVSFWRVPFEVVARWSGQPGFPDRLALGAFMALTLLWILWVFTVPPACRTVGDWLAGLGEHPEAIASVLVLALFPPFLTLCRARFDFPDETTAYAYLFSIALLAAALQFIRTPRFSLFYGLCMGSALIGFFNSTALFYGVASMLVVIGYTRVLKWPWRDSFLGLMLFCLGGVALFASNLHRFGSGSEFGNGLALFATDEAVFASRFSHPFATEPLLSAAKELFSLLFLADGSFNANDWYKTAFFPEQSPTFRLRALYFSTYDLVYLGLLVLGVGLGLCRWVNDRHSKLQAKLRESNIMALWAFLSLIPLTWHYLRHPYISSHDLLDFAPAIAVAALSCVWAIGQEKRPLWLARPGVRYGLLVVLVAWWIVETETAKVASDSGSSTAGYQILRLRTHGKVLSRTIPGRYAVGSFDNQGIPFNGFGWDPKTGETASCATFFVSEPEILEIIVASRSERQTQDQDFAKIQAMIGLEKLILVTNEAVTGGRRLVFAAPQKPFNRNGVQVASLAFVAPNELSAQFSRFRLLGVKWHRNGEAFDVAELLRDAAPEGTGPLARLKNPLADQPAGKSLAESVPLPTGIMAYDSDHKETTIKEGEAEAHFIFNITNISRKDFTITSVIASCGCTTADVPPMPWTLAPHAKGQIPVTMNVLGHTGKSTKTITVTTLQGVKAFDVTANILPPPLETPNANREQNLALAKADRQAVFKGDCAKCHAEPVKGKFGQELYASACGICHDANPRATMVSDLRSLNHPTDEAFWKQWITNGKPDTLMPAFSQTQGGPLTSEQIDSLAKTLATAFPAYIAQPR